MRKIVVFLVFILSVFVAKAQEEFNAIVNINADKVQSSNKQVYKTLQDALTEFVNQTKWTNKKFLPQERINCAFNIVVNSQANNSFSASLQIQSTRPVYGSSYETPLLNINDKSFNFIYNEFEPLIYNPNSFDSNLVSTIVFYVYIILGVDADTFALNGGKEYFKQAESVMLRAQQRGDKAWQNEVGEQNRFALIDNFISPKYATIHKIYYDYHRNGLDHFASDEKKAKEVISNNVIQLKKLHNVTVGNYSIRLFLDAKADEIVNIFANGKRTGKEIELKEVVEKIAPTQSDKWKKIK